MRIAVDLDEVLGHFLPAFCDYHNEKYKTNLKMEDFFSYKFWDVLKEDKDVLTQKVYDFHETDYFENIKPIDEAIKAIEKLSHHHELIIITSRQIDIKDQTEAWVETYYPGKFKAIHFANHHAQNKKTRKSKNEICNTENIDILIEDSLEYATECLNSERKIFLFDYPWNQKKNLPKNIIRVKNWDEILKTLSSNSSKNSEKLI